MVGRTSQHVRCCVLAVGLVAIAACASDSAPSVLRSESTPGTQPISTNPDTTGGSDTTETDSTDPETTSGSDTTDPGPDTTDAGTTDPGTTPPSGPPTVDTQPTTPPTSQPSTTLDPKAVEDAVAQWTAVCADVVAGLAALPTDVSLALGELAKVMSDFGVAASTIPETGAPNDPTNGVRLAMTDFATSVTDAAMAFAGGNAAEAERLLGEAFAHVERILTHLRDFGADC